MNYYFEEQAKTKLTEIIQKDVLKENFSEMRANKA